MYNVWYLWQRLVFPHATNKAIIFNNNFYYLAVSANLKYLITWPTYSPKLSVVSIIGNGRIVLDLGWKIPNPRGVLF